MSTRPATPADRAIARLRPYRNEEDTLQIISVAFLAAALPPDAWSCHIPNGGKRSKATAGRLKAMGVRAGAPDWLIVWQGRAFFIELKAAKGSPSKAQKVVHPAILTAGCPVAVCRSIDAIETTLRGWGIPLRATAQGIAA